jgi:hypothetical protein
MKRVFALALCFLLCVLCGAQTASADSPVSLDEYRAAVAQAFDLVTQAAAQSSDARAPLLNQAASVLERINAVTLPSGAQSNIDNRELVALIRDPNKAPAAQTRLAALREALTQPLAPVTAPDLVLLQNILERPPFAEEANALPGWLQEILLRISRFFDRLFDNTARGVLDARDLIILLGIALVIFVLVYFIRGLRRNLVKEEALANLPEMHEVRTPGEAFNNAQAFVNQGDYRNAVRQLYLATLLLLDQHGKIKYDPTLTNREYLHQTSNDPRTTAALAPIVETFDRTWYGFESITSAEFDAYRARVEQVKEL